MKRSNRSALKYMVLPIALASLMIATLNASWPMYIVGQLCGAIFFAQSFILVHEFGHYSLFESRRVNQIGGYLFSLFVFIPFHNWCQIHGLHHKWTGWRDKDPTTEKTFSDRLSNTQEGLINFCWRWYVPLFTIGYRLGIYWKAEKLKRYLSEDNYQRCIREIYLYSAVYLITMCIFPKVWVGLCPALLLSFVITDILTLSQHSHIEMKSSNGEEVRSLRYRDQAQYSRSLIVPDLIGQFVLLNFNHHEAHHVYPGIPCYKLHELNESYTNSYPILPWLKRVKSIKGVDFIFRSSADRDDF